MKNNFWKKFLFEPRFTGAGMLLYGTYTFAMALQWDVVVWVCVFLVILKWSFNSNNLIKE